MIRDYLSNANFHEFLVKLDLDLAEQIRIKGCLHCSGTLHRADYPRSPLGLPRSSREYYLERYSFCCDQDGCRKRVTSPSVRFFGRRRYPTFLIVLICALRFGCNEKRLRQIQQLFGLMIDRKTWQRWVIWWLEVFTTTAFWKSMTGIISIANVTTHFPRNLLEIYKGSLQERLVQVLQLLTPLTAGVLRAV